MAATQQTPTQQEAAQQDTTQATATQQEAAQQEATQQEVSQQEAPDSIPSSSSDELLDLPNEILVKIVDEVLGQAYIDSSRWQAVHLLTFPEGLVSAKAADRSIGALSLVCHTFNNQVKKRAAVKVPHPGLPSSAPLRVVVRTQRKLAHLDAILAGSVKN